jgi:hypothetical protein
MEPESRQYRFHNRPPPVPILSPINPVHALTSHFSPGPRQVFMFRNKANFYGEELSALRTAPKLEDHPFSAVAVTLHIGGRSSIRNLTTHHPVVTGTHPIITDSPRFNIQKFYFLSTQCIYMFCVDLRTNSDYFPIQH